MVLFKFGDFDYLCREVPSLPVCNLFFRQLLVHPKGLPAPASALLGLPSSTSTNFTSVLSSLGSGVNPSCSIPRMAKAGGAPGNLGNIANIILFWCLLWVAFLSLQVVEDGTFPSILPMMAGLVILTVGSGYIAVDTGFTVTQYFLSDDPAKLHSTWLFVLTLIWPAVAAFSYFSVQLVVVVRVLKESKPLILFSISAVLFVLSQADYFALSNTICHGSNGKVDGSFIATLLETGAVGALFVAWRSITEDSWDGIAYMD
ncbi:hypothetical protein RQP46_006276 [Phenoliferia psychrophenolica]